MSGKDDKVDLRQCGLLQWVVRGDSISPKAWERAEATGDVVGTCRSCGGYLVPDSVPFADQVTMAWFQAHCLDCGHEVASPAGRLLRRRPIVPTR